MKQILVRFDNALSTISREWLVVFGILILTIGVRLWYVSDGSIIFNFDQARDAYITRQMFRTADIKIQGPNVSGTADTLYHGVLYYYVLSPLYAISSNPQFVVSVQIIFTTLGLIPVYIVVKSVTKRRIVAIGTLLLAAFSVSHVQAATWLSNPTLALSTVPMLYLALWKVFGAKNKRWVPVVALALGLSIQAALWLGYLGAVVLLSYVVWNVGRHHSERFLTTKDYAVFVLLLALSTSTMALTQIQLARAGIFTIEAAQMALGSAGETMQYSLSQTFAALTLYLEKLSKAYLPVLPFISFGILVWVVSRVSSLPRNVTQYLVLWLVGPLMLLAVHTRVAQHLFITTELPLYAITVWLFLQLVERYTARRMQYGIMAVIFVIYAVVQLSYLQQQKVHRIHDYTLQTGMFLHEQLAAIDWTYQEANLQPFSISSFTAPYGYNTVWAYLYDWYGREKYGYVPSFYGGAQTGIFAGELLETAAQPTTTHFVIIEPNVGAPESIFRGFELEQSQNSTYAGTQVFGTLKIDKRTAIYAN